MAIEYTTFDVLVFCERCGRTRVGQDRRRGQVKRVLQLWQGYQLIRQKESR